MPSIRIVVPRYGSQIIGGTEGLTRLLADHLMTGGWDVSVWSTTASDEATWRGDLAAREDDSGVSVRRFPVARHRRPALFHQATRAFFRLPERVRPETSWVRAQGPYAPALVAELRRATSTPTLFSPYLYYPTLIGLPVAPRPRLLMPAAHDERPLRLHLVGRSIRACDAIWYHTSEEQALLESVHPVAASKPSAVGTVGVDAYEPADGARFRARYGVDGAFLFFAGRSARGKGFGELLDAYAVLRSRRTDIQLVIAGDHAADHATSGVRLVGRLDSSALRDALAAATGAVVPSAMESLSLMALETWAAGRPALLNGRSPVLREQAARSGGALLFSSPAQFADAANALADDSSLARRLGESGRAFVAANYRWEDVVSRLSSLIAEAAATTHDPA